MRAFSFSALSVACIIGASYAQVDNSLPYDFTLAAFSTAGPNDNSTGVPLVLGQNGAEQGIQFHVTSTWFSFPYNLFPRLTLKNGVLQAYGRDTNRLDTNATEVKRGDALRWNTTTAFNKPGPEIYTAVKKSDSEFLNLAAYGNDDLWSICTFNGAPGEPDLKLKNVVFDVAAATVPNENFDRSSCFPVDLHIVKA